MVDITDWNDLDAAIQGTNGSEDTGDYVLQNDLDSDTAGYSGIGDSWQPCGANATGDGGTGFQGTFDGGGYEIRDLVIDDASHDTTTSRIGLFGSTSGGDGTTVVENLGVRGTIDVNNDVGQIGLLVGNFSDANEIRDCYIEGSLTNATDCVDVGGLAGLNGSLISNCYSLVDVSVPADVDGLGGFVGDNRETIQQAYSSGSVSADSGSVGGFVGDLDTSTETDCYWDTEASGQSTSTGSATGLTTSEMQGSSATTNLSGFDFSGTWETVEASQSDTSADGYAILQAITRETQLDAQGVLQTGINGVAQATDTDVGTSTGTLTVLAVATGTDFDTAAATGTRTRGGIATGTDLDIATATGTVTLFGSATSTDTDTGSAILTALVNATLEATDTGVGTATATRARVGTGSGVDTDVATTTGTRLRTGTSTATDTDFGSATGLLTVIAVPTATDTDVGTVTPTITFFSTPSAIDTETGSATLLLTVPKTDANDPVQAVVDILSQAGQSFYSKVEPDAIAPLSQNRPKARKGEEKAIWVWSSAATDIDDFDAEYSRTTRTATVEAILQLNQSDREGDFADVATFAEDVVQLLSRYARDNKTKTQFHSIKVVQREDRRAQNIPTNSLPYGVALTIELSRLVETR